MGLYFAGKKEIAEHYRTTLTNRDAGVCQCPPECKEPLLKGLAVTLSSPLKFCRSDQLHGLYDQNLSAPY